MNIIYVVIVIGIGTVMALALIKHRHRQQLNVYVVQDKDGAKHQYMMRGGGYKAKNALKIMLEENVEIKHIRYKPKSKAIKIGVLKPYHIYDYDEAIQKLPRPITKVLKQDQVND